MSDTIYAYKNKLWKVLLNFQYTGTTVPFTLNQGKYLLICHGAHGGNGYITNASETMKATLVCDDDDIFKMYVKELV